MIVRRIVVLAIWIGSAIGGEAVENVPKFSINSPRKSGENQPESGVAVADEDLATKSPGSSILVKLPDDIQKHLESQKHDRSRIHASILGFPVDPTSVFNDRSTTEKARTEAAEDAPESPWTTPSRATEDLTSESTTTVSQKKEVFTTSPEDDADITKELPMRSVWSIAWEAHVYFSGTLFVLLAIYCFVNILRLHTFSRLFSRGYFVALNLVLIVVGVLRPVLLFHDPYNEEGQWPKYAAYLLLDTPYPCITSGFAVLFLALLRSTQIELVSPAFQTPRALFIFCSIHFVLSFGIDVSIGLLHSLRYILLISQGFFIVWSLLLSAGYFYIFSTMNKVAMRHHSDMMRSVYPKLMLDGTSTYSGHTNMMQSTTSGGGGANMKRPPLARAVHLTLGVAVLGSLMGGVQLFAMIKMLGLLKDDMSSDHNEWAWYGYQVSMRVLEVTICTLLAVIATTPLRSDPEQSPAMGGGSGCAKWFGCCSCSSCCGDTNPPRELEDEIYSEICSNNHSVRQVLDRDGFGMPLGTLPTSASLAAGTGNMTFNHKRATMNTHHMNGSATMGRMGGDVARPMCSMGYPPPGGGAYPPTPAPGAQESMASSRATLESALYSNIRSRPSSMLFNDSGFVRFRLGNDPAPAHNRSSQNLAQVMEQEQQQRNLEREGLKASQSFDETVLLMDATGRISAVPSDQLSPADPPRTVCSPIYKSIDSVHSDQEIQAIQGLQGVQGIQPTGAAGYSESDLSVDPVYNQAIYQAIRPPSRCSSISATQSFDLRMYGRTRAAKQANATYNSGTLSRNEEMKEKLENPYYYYGSTRAQKGAKKEKPRPLLPSQRQQLEMQERGPSRQANPERPPSRPTSRQALLYEQQPDVFQRSRSLGHHYARRDLPPAPPPPISRNSQSPFVPQTGSMTPISYTRRNMEQKRFNPLYDTPPTQRAHNRFFDPPHQLMDGGGVGFYGGEIRGVMGTPPTHRHAHGGRGLVTQLPLPMRHLRNQMPEPMLSPILTDQESSPLHTAMGGPYRYPDQAPSGPYRYPDQGPVPPKADYLTDPTSDSDEDISTTFDQATHGSLADNESELSSMFGLNNQDLLQKDPKQGEKRIDGAPTNFMSPLEYSAMLKLYSAGTDDPPPKAKDITPDSGVVADSQQSGTEGPTQSSKSGMNQSRNSIISSSSSLNDIIGSAGRAAPSKKKPSGQTKAYLRLSDQAGTKVPNLFSSSSEDEDEVPQAQSTDKKYHPLVSPPSTESYYPAFRSDAGPFRIQPISNNSKMAATKMATDRSKMAAKMAEKRPSTDSASNDGGPESTADDYSEVENLPSDESTAMGGDISTGETMSPGVTIDMNKGVAMSPGVAIAHEVIDTCKQIQEAQFVEH